MSRPFGVLVSERAKLPQDVIVKQAMSRLTRWQQLSSDKKVSLDEIAWLGALYDVAIRTAQQKVERQKAEAAVKKQMETKVAEHNGGKVHHVTLTDGVAVQDGVR